MLGVVLRLEGPTEPEALERAEILKVRSRSAPLVRAVSAVQELETATMLTVTINHGTISADHTIDT